MGNYAGGYFKSREKQTITNLKAVGLRKCRVCGMWMDKEHIKKGVCNECKYMEVK